MNQLHSKKSLRSRIIGAGSWVLGGHVLHQFIRLGSNLIMTRLLVPEMFGVMALANVLYVGLALFSDLGLRANIIKSNRGDDPVFLNTVWTVQIIRGGIIWILGLGLSATLYLSGSAQVWASNSVYADPNLPYVTAIITFNAFISGFNSTNLASANRKLSLGLITRIEVFSQIIGLVFMIIWAVIDRSIWALVAGSLLGSTVKMTLSHIAIPGLKNSFHWDYDSFWEIFHFGKWIFLTSILGFLAVNGDRLILGSLVDSKILGLYAIAFFIVQGIELVFNKLTMNVAFAALSEVIRDRPQELSRIYYKFRLPVDFVSLFAAGFLFMTGQILINVLYDDRYLQAGHMLEILSISLIMVRYSLANQCFIALGKPKLLVPTIVVRLAVVFLLVPVTYTRYGLEVSLWVIAGSRLPTLPIIIYLKSKYNILNVMREYYAVLFLAFGLAGGWLLKQIVTAF